MGDARPELAGEAARRLLGSRDILVHMDGSIIIFD
jgi:hypothetical protein